MFQQFNHFYGENSQHEYRKKNISYLKNIYMNIKYLILVRKIIL